MRALTFETAETVTLSYHVMQDGSAKDITGMSFTFGAKLKHTDTLYEIDPVAGSIDSAAEGKFSFSVTMPDSPFAGLYAVVMTDGVGNRTVLSSRGGDAIKALESLID